MTHPAADLLRAIADGKQMECFERPQWRKCDATVAIIHIGHGDHDRVRIARPMVTREVSYPEPLRDFPESGKAAWCVSPEYLVVQSIQTRELMKRFIDHGMAFATEADAAEAHKALFGGGV